MLPDDVRATRSVIRAFETADLVLIAPSNPFVSIDPILNVYPIRALLMDLPQAVIAVSPIVGGQAVKLGLATARPEAPPDGSAPGTVLGLHADALEVATGAGVLCLHKLQRPGGRMLEAAEFLRGFAIATGTVLPSTPMSPLVRGATT